MVFSLNENSSLSLWSVLDYHIGCRESGQQIAVNITHVFVDNKYLEED